MDAARMDGVRSVTVDPAVVDRTIMALQFFGHRRLEGLVLWLGSVEPGRARVIRAIVPEQRSVADENGLGYFVNGETLFELNRTLAETGLRLIAQVHSHPEDAYHSPADDRYSIVTADGGFSLVVPNFGRAPANLASWAVYRLKRGDWQELSAQEVQSLFEIRHCEHTKD
jgi:hypothetical protein